MVYVAALGALLATLALLRDGRRRRHLLPVAGATVAVIAAGLLQLP